eukprot:CAMPEP_0179617784 /NCGR_PEP_ID=MMETSP0930-20121108/7338_1 /TAXON_ID=548131 ORGANISM="Ostreococcus mediterraneus, Strain clade-D-RCC1621" /NCGR_SAMPLE_ID=MMETSP0930 /ASSEMBLY_ACC=CAM_ASM_000580 /LENGTH=82 /DNA_ID=CAMNT_0021486701 /DNA_START=304 /DNA_END=552 /DNA_ORIENTATION=-
MKLTARLRSLTGMACASMECNEGNTTPIAAPMATRHHHICLVKLPSLGTSKLNKPHAKNATCMTLSPPYFVASAPPGICDAV